MNTEQNKEKNGEKTFRITDISFWIYAGIFALVFILCLLFGGTDYVTRKPFPLSNPFYFVIGAAAMFGICLLVRKLTDSSFYQKYEHVFIAVFSVFALTGSLLAVRYYSFIPGWDAGFVFDGANQLVDDGSVNVAYYSQYPNNLFLTILFSFIIRLADFTKQFVGGISRYYALAAFQCFSAVLSAYLTYYSVKKLTAQKETALLSWFLFLILGIFSPWVAVPYSDMTGLLFLSLALFIYSTEKYDFFLGLTLILGYYIKPTVLIFGIAFFLHTLLKLPRELKPVGDTVPDKKKVFLKPLLFLAGILIGILLVKICVRSVHVSLDKEKAFGSDQFIMMGLNEETNGVYSAEDVLFSESFDTAAKRRDADLKEAGKRLQEMGLWRLMRHTGKKLLTAFNDGSFAWFEEGGFIRDQLYSGNTKADEFFHNIYYPDGRYYPFYLSLVQTVWITVLSLAAYYGFVRTVSREESKNIKNPRPDSPDGDRIQKLSVLKLAMTGYILFEIFFEPRARHILVCLPIILLFASAGCYHKLPRRKHKG